MKNLRVCDSVNGMGHTVVIRCMLNLIATFYGFDKKGPAKHLCYRVMEIKIGDEKAGNRFINQAG